jgi:hypothetical protein
MKKLLIGTALLVTALPFTFDGVTPTVSKADARIGRPLTPMSVAGVHRRVMRRNYGVGANLGYHPVARAAAYGAAAAGAGYYGAGYGGSGYSYPSYGYGYGSTGYNYPAYGSGYGTGYSYPAYSSGYGAGYGDYYGYHPVARAALYGAAATGAGYYGAGYGGGYGYGYGNSGYNPPGPFTPAFGGTGYGYGAW